MSKNAAFAASIRPTVTILTTIFFFGVLAAGLYLDKFSYDRAVDTLVGIFGWTVGYYFAKREDHTVKSRASDPA